MGQEPEVIENDIENRRGDLSRDLDALADKVSPRRVMGRRVDSAKGRASSVKNMIMGSAQGVSDTVSGTSQSASESASNAAHGVTDKAKGNPLAAGLIAFGAGWLVSSLIPASAKEAELSGQALTAAKEHGQPLMDQAKSVGKEVGEDLKESATEAASDLGSSAQTAAQHVAEEGRSAAQDVRKDAP